MERGEAYCSGCGKPRPIIAASIDGRYPIVQCGRVKRAGLLDKAAARLIIRERRKRVKARKAATAVAYGPDRLPASDPRSKRVE